MVRANGFARILASRCTTAPEKSAESSAAISHLHLATPLPPVAEAAGMTEVTVPQDAPPTIEP
ncbi:MAG: hypothetical protein RJA70_3136, partial [Pseudomonadota bacterium]